MTVCSQGLLNLLKEFHRELSQKFQRGLQMIYSRGGSNTPDSNSLVFSSQPVSQFPTFKASALKQMASHLTVE